MRRRVMVFLSVAALAVAVGLSPVVMADEPPPRPVLRVGLGGAFFGDYWPAEVDLMVTADDPETVETPDIAVTVTTDAEGSFQLDWFAGLQAGWFITVTDGEITQSHTVRNISITGVDTANDIIYGTADPNTVVDYAGNPEHGQGGHTVANSNGEWSIDLTGVYDIPPRTPVVALQIDDYLCYQPNPYCDGDFTYTNFWTGKCLGLQPTMGAFFTDAGETVWGTAGDDVIVGGSGNDIINGRGGNDRICGGPGNDTINGGPGNDRVQGETGYDTLWGGSGKDVLSGGPGNDSAHGGSGIDTANGGPGTDTCVAETERFCEL